MARKFLTGVDLNSQRALAMADPQNATDGANKQYVDNAIRGVKWKDALAASTTNVSVSAFSGTTLDGVTLTSGSSVILLKNQTTGSENGLWLYNGSGSALTRASTLPTAADARGVAVTVQGGSTNDDTVWICTADPAVVGTDALTFAQLAGGATYTADGLGIEVAANQFSLELDGTTLSKSATGLKANTAVLASKLFAVNNTTSSQTTVATHNLGTLDTMVEVYEIATGDVIDGWNITARSTTAVTLDFGSVIGAGVYRILVRD